MDLSNDSKHVRHHLIAALSQSSFLQFIGHGSAHLETLQAMIETSAVVNYKRGKVILREGEPGDRMYFLAAGEVEVSREGRTICTMARLGDVFGEMGALTGAARAATITALTDVTCLVTDPIFTRQLRESGEPEFLSLMQQALTKLLTGRLRMVSEELAEAKEALAESKHQLKLMQKTNEQLGKEIAELRSQMKERFHSAPRGAGGKGGSR